MISKKLLFVDDEEVEDFVSALIKGGYEIDLACDSTEALNHLSHNHYDIVILDIMMSHGNELPLNVPARRTGIEILRMIREGLIDSVDQNIPILVMTALGTSYEIDDIRNYKVNDIIQKPVSPDIVLMQVDEVMSTYPSI
jgi:CheY-like chemotaxis protein